MKVLSFPGKNAITDVPTGLRELADLIESGGFADIQNLVWVIDRGHESVDVGMMGQAATPTQAAYFLLGVAMRNLELGSALG
jgi:hypothetical protein